MRKPTKIKEIQGESQLWADSSQDWEKKRCPFTRLSSKGKSLSGTWKQTRPLSIWSAQFRHHQYWATVASVTAEI
jgi:hypothetical protein